MGNVITNILQWRIQGGGCAPPISPNDFTDPARPRPLFHRLFTKSCACITIVMHALTKFVSILHKRGSHCGSPSSKKRAWPIIAFLSVARCTFSAQSFCFENTDWLNRKERLLGFLYPAATGLLLRARASDPSCSTKY